MKKLIALILLISMVGCIKRAEFDNLKDRVEFQEKYNQAQDESIYNLKKMIDSKLDKEKKQ